MQHRADHDDGDHRQRAGAAGEHVDHRPPVQHRELVADHVLDDLPEQAALGGQAREGLHHHHVGERVLRRAGQVRVVDTRPGAARPRSCARRSGVSDDEQHHQHDQGRGQAPVHEEGERQQHDDRDIGRELLAEEAQPQAEQRVRAAEHDLHQPAGMDVAVERQRQRQHVAEIAVHDGEAVAVRHALGVQRDGDVGRDARPRRRRTRCRSSCAACGPERVGRQLVRLGQHADDAAEQHGIEELQPGDDQVGDAQHDRQPLVAAERRQHAAVDLEEAHASTTNACAMRRP